MTWHILTTMPGRERGVAVSLAVRGIMAYAPLVRLSRRKVAPMFAGYVFVGNGLLTQRALREIGQGFSFLAGNDERPAELSHAAIMAIAAHAEALADRWQQPFRPGDLVVVSADGGPWEGVEGIVARLDGADKIILEAMLPGRSTSANPAFLRRVCLPVQWLELASHAPPKRHIAGDKSRIASRSIA